MTKSISYNRTDTPVSGVSSLNLPIAVLNYKADFTKEVNTPGEGIITNVTSPLIAPERMRFAVTPIADIYKGTGIDPTLAAPSKRGLTVLVQLQDTWTVTDSADATYRVDLPVTGHFVLRVPQNEMITADALKTFIGRTMSGFFNTGVVTTERIVGLLRGSMMPSDL
jgi:hypothetical protein